MPIDVDAILASLGDEFMDPGHDQWGGANLDTGGYKPLPVDRSYMKRAEALERVAEAVATAETIAIADVERTVPHTQEIINWLNIADHWLQLSHNLYDPSPDADVKEEGNQG